MIPLAEFGKHGNECPDAGYRCVCGLFTRHEVACTALLASEFLGHLAALIGFLAAMSTDRGHLGHRECSTERLRRAELAELEAT